MYTCSCCGDPVPIKKTNTIQMVNGNNYHVCTDCIDFMWHKRSPDYKALKKQQKAAKNGKDTSPILRT